MEELWNAFDNAVDQWHTDKKSNEPLHAWLGLSREEYKTLVECPEALFYVFYSNENFQNIILETINNN